jgi:hypothetical protein
MLKENDLLPCVTCTHIVREGEELALGSSQNKHLRVCLDPKIFGKSSCSTFRYYLTKII